MWNVSTVWTHKQQVDYKMNECNYIIQIRLLDEIKPGENVQPGTH